MTRVSYNKLSLEGFYRLQNRRYFLRPLPCACLALHARVEICSPEKREIIPSVLQATFKPNPEMPYLGEKDEQSLKVTAIAEKINKSISIQRKANRELQKWNNWNLVNWYRKVNPTKATCFPFIGDFLALLTSCTCKQKSFFVIILLFCRNMYDA